MSDLTITSRALKVIQAMDKYDIAILEFFSNRKPREYWPALMIGKALGIDQTTVSRRLRKLHKMKVIVLPTNTRPNGSTNYVYSHVSVTSGLGDEVIHALAYS